MPSKKEYEEVFNKLLGVDVKWSKLSKEELAQLAMVFGNPEILLKRLGLEEEFRVKLAREKMVDAGMTILKSWNGPLARVLRKWLGVE